MAKKKTEKPLPTCQERILCLTSVQHLPRVKFEANTIGVGLDAFQHIRFTGNYLPVKLPIGMATDDLVDELNKVTRPIFDRLADELEAEALRR